MKKNAFWSRVAALLLCAVLLCPLLPAVAEEELVYTHIAKATSALKVRVAPAKDANGNDSIAKGDYVYILEYGEEWCKVKAHRNVGYIMTRYLTDITPYDASQVAQSSTPVTGQIEEQPKEETPAPSFTMTESAYEAKYKCSTVKAANLLTEPADNARRKTSISIYKELTVGEISGDWCLAQYNNTIGYIRTDSLFKWDRIDPYAGDIPGLTVWPNLIFMNHSTVVYDTDTNEELKTINPGAAICASEVDSLGRYTTPYHRQMGYVTENDVAYVMPVVPWEEAEEGDLISVMTTYFAVGISTLQYQGRNWNIRLSGSLITGTVLQPGEDFDMNNTIGPYAKSTGYKEAPIMSPRAQTGYGGGTCQTNTTFYNTVIQVPLLVTHRKVHANVGMEYIPKGFDAAVGAGDINLTMVNTLPYAIRFQFFISDGVLTCCIFRA